MFDIAPVLSAIQSAWNALAITLTLAANGVAKSDYN